MNGEKTGRERRWRPGRGRGWSRCRCNGCSVTRREHQRNGEQGNADAPKRARINLQHLFRVEPEGRSRREIPANSRAVPVAESAAKAKRAGSFVGCATTGGTRRTKLCRPGIGKLLLKMLSKNFFYAAGQSPEEHKHRERKSTATMLSKPGPSCPLGVCSGEISRAPAGCSLAGCQNIIRMHELQFTSRRWRWQSPRARGRDNC